MKLFSFPPYCFSISDETVDRSVFGEQKCKSNRCRISNFDDFSPSSTTQITYFNIILVGRRNPTRTTSFLKRFSWKFESNFFLYFLPILSCALTFSFHNILFNWCLLLWFATSEPESPKNGRVQNIDTWFDNVSVLS